MWEAINNASGLVSLIVVLVPLGLKAWRLWREWRIRRSRVALEREIASVERLAASPAARTEMSLWRLFIALAVLGVWIMFQGFAFDDAGHKIVLLSHLVCGAAIYLLASATLGDFVRIRNAERTVAGLRAKLDALAARP
jgi:hypothetical protein